VKNKLLQLILSCCAGLVAFSFSSSVRADPVDGHGIHVTDYRPVAGSSRLKDAIVTSDAIFAGGEHIELTVRILFPADYEANPTLRYPVLYLLHGGAGTFEDWSKTTADGGQIETTVGSHGVIVVMPEGGRAGWYSDWAGPTDGGFAPLWETFHVQQLVPWIDANFRTVGTAAGRAIAGLSMGGLGALKYAGQNPSVFSAVGSFSGAVDLKYESAQDTISNSMWVYGATVVDTGLLDTGYRVTFPPAPPEEEETLRLINLFGEPNENQDWPDANPMLMTGDYKASGIKLALYSGRRINPWELAAEQDIANMNDPLHQALNQAQVVHRYCSGYGEHSYTYWREDLKDFLTYVYGTPEPCTSSPCPCTGNPGWVIVQP
jgi:S-formylglutathione hydrolase FrmB